MGKAKYRCPLLNAPHQWHEETDVTGKVFIWKYPDYKCRGLSIRLMEDGRYIPLVNGSNDFRITNSTEKYTLGTLEEAKVFLFKYVDDVIANDVRFNEKYKQEFLKNYVSRRLEKIDK